MACPRKASAREETAEPSFAAVQLNNNDSSCEKPQGRDERDAHNAELIDGIAENQNEDTEETVNSSGKKNDASEICKDNVIIDDEG